MARILKKLASALKMHALKRNTFISWMRGLSSSGAINTANPGTSARKGER
jgi:hypothetical protein